MEFLNDEVESLNNEVERDSNEVKGRGVQAGFRIFCRFILQLHPNYDIKAFEALVTPKVMGQAINKMEEEVVTLEIAEPFEDLGNS